MNAKLSLAFRLGQIAKLIAAVFVPKHPNQQRQADSREVYFQDVPREIVAEHLKNMRNAIR